MSKRIFADKPPENWLSALRNGVATFDLCKKELFRTLAKNNKTLKDIGSSEEEIEQLQTQNPRKVGVNYAKFWLNKIRSTKNPDPRCLTQLTLLMRKHNISMEEIGATQTDLA